MPKPDYDDADVEEEWCDAQRKIVEPYLRSQNVAHGRIGDWPAWHVAPYASIWAIESVDRPEWIGWWVICGDLPTDYISSRDVTPPQHPRKAMSVFAARWLEVVSAWERGEAPSNGIKIGGAHQSKELAPLLKSRAALLLEWSEDESFWEEE